MKRYLYVETDTGVVWTCPICGKKLSLIHKEADSYEDDKGEFIKMRKPKILHGMVEYQVNSRRGEMMESEYVKCPNCKGTGKVIIRYREPPHQNEYFVCWMCYGKGMLKKELLKELEEKLR